MEDYMLSGIFIVYTILCFVVYHKAFEVVYFDLGKGCLSEIFWCSVVGAILTELTVILWWVTDIIIGIVAISCIRKCKSGSSKVFVVLFALALAFMVFYLGTEYLDY